VCAEAGKIAASGGLAGGEQCAKNEDDSGEARAWFRKSRRKEERLAGQESGWGIRGRMVVEIVHKEGGEYRLARSKGVAWTFFGRGAEYCGHRACQNKNQKTAEDRMKI